MKYIIFVLTLFALACNNSKPAPETTTQLSGTFKTVEIVVSGMTCTGCEGTIQSNVADLEGIESVKASHTQGNTVVNYDPELADTSIIKQKITESGYSVVSISLSN